MGDGVEHRMGEDELAAERAQMRVVAWASFIAAACLIVAVGLYVMVFADAVKDAGTSRADLDVAHLTAVHEHNAQWIMYGLFTAVAFAMIAVVLGFLATAARRRQPELPKIIAQVAYGGPALVAVAAPLTVIAWIVAANDFITSTAGAHAAAAAAFDQALPLVTNYVAMFANIVAAVAWLAIGLYCRRVGVITRLVGGVALTIAVVSLFMVASPPVLSYVLQFFWMVAVGVMLLASPQTQPPAWNLGTVVSWNEVRAARDAALYDEVAGVETADVATDAADDADAETDSDADADEAASDDSD